MKLLLDTHTALWLFNDYDKLSPKAKNILLDNTNELFISIVSAWEIAIKHSIGKLTEFPDGVKIFLAEIKVSPMEIVSVEPEYVEKVEELSLIHRDPFDRILIATALCENMTIVTADENIQKYDVKYVW